VPVVFSHGGGCDVRSWDPQCDAIAASHRFVAYSQRFRGRSDSPPDGDDTQATHVSDLIAIIRSLGEPVHLVGFSSAVALLTALRAAQLLRSLIVVEPNIPWLLEADAEGEAVRAQFVDAIERARISASGDLDRYAALWFELVNNRGPGTFEAQPATFREMWLANMRPPGATSSTREPVTRADLATLGAIPTLVLSAEHGMPYSRLITERVQRCLPGSELRIVPGVTHFMSYQAPDAFNEIVLEFIARQ
jgi:pimeloyl-ACP methyl ester carboxylesterase